MITPLIKRRLGVWMSILSIYKVGSIGLLKAKLDRGNKGLTRMRPLGFR
ncbi:hypothetical protein VCRA2122O339_80144 [Vibrio crassostreae]|nr:hypothetical protein VCRA2120E331_70020 [Vibrio crassostreae]CAK3603282.1 hypothetical protein VCRA2127O345_70020 [Vibrio crassostreae]CAK3637363.1 hypothetical protein VCRA2122O338_70020 [Vibrio crassostreae]CAK3640808.1 hypothetical protein VCRA2120E330_80143 [Vibrio crassostreae]CAK3674909.1 hypothetical protein VCRA2122O339_80144 [Vibrio crassostreae]